MDEAKQNLLLSQTLAAILTVEEKFKKIQENPALYGAENGFTAGELAT
jgi:hypothetical protein